MYGSFCYFTLLPKLGNISVYGGYALVSHCIFNFYFPDEYDIEHLYLYLLAINFFSCFFIFEREREREREQEKGKERETQNLKKVPGYELSAQNLSGAQTHRLTEIMT